MELFEKDRQTDGKPTDKTGARPLADRMRPRTFEEFAGQEKVVGEGSPLRDGIVQDNVPSLIFWGPPGTGKTTLAELIARSTHGQFVRFSAVVTGIKEVKQIISKARGYYEMSGRRTYIFIDEIHRFNKAQQDAFLPYVEKGDIVLIGATTENPSFEVNSALLSRMRVYVLNRLTDKDILKIIKQTLADNERGLAGMNLTANENVLNIIAKAADGDARRGLTLLEAVAVFAGANTELTLDHVRKVHQQGGLRYDKSGEEHYNVISALHKTIRGGDPDAALYWLARMLEAGEDPKYIIRRLVRFATEDIGLADPYALTLTMNARDSYHFLGSPEGDLVIAQAVVYMACAPKSNAIYTAYTKAQNDAKERGTLDVPLWLRNAPTGLMKDLGYGKGYQYAHDAEGALTDQEYFPAELAGTEYYHPTDAGREARLAEYLKKFKAYRSGETDDDGGDNSQK